MQILCLDKWLGYSYRKNWIWKKKNQIKALNSVNIVLLNIFPTYIY